MKIFDLIDKFLLDEMIEKKYINVQKHPTTDLWIYNYSKSCQVDKVWNEATINCRGLIVDSKNNIVARPFKKFYNYEELVEMGTDIPNLPFDVYEKMDGSLGILYWFDDVPFLATRGSFDSEQAIHGTEILQTKYIDTWNRFDRDKTYLFEIIYPQDKHCINYGEMDDIILLAVIDTDTGLETDSIDNYRDVLSVTKHYDGIIDWKTIREEFDGENREGFVVRFSNGFRMKLKYEQYFKIHFLRSMISKKFILEHIIDNTLHEIADIINELDEENQIYYHNIIDELYKRYNDINDDVNRMYRPSTEFESQKDYAAWVLTLDKYSAMIFSKDKGKDYSRFIWKLIKNEIKECPTNKDS